MIIPFLEKVAFLDAALTGRGEKEVFHTASNTMYRTAKEWVLNAPAEVYYLSDGGYSRIVVSESFKIRLSDNSREEVKQAWGRCRELIADVETDLLEAYDDLCLETHP